MQNMRLLDIDLRLFDGAGGAGAGGEGSAGSGAAPQANNSALPKADNQRGPGSSRRGKTGAYDNVVFGKQEDVPGTEAAGSDAGSAGAGNTKKGVDTTSNTLEERRAAFKEMIEGEYKDVYTETFQQAFNRRFRDVKGMENSLNAQKPILDMLMQRYGIADGDMAKLQNAIEEDTGYWEEAAEEAGLTVEQYKAMQKLERENAEFKAMQQRQLGEQQAQQQLAVWYKGAEQVKELYPGFDLRTEIQNQHFRGLLKAGVSVQDAYELVHKDEIRVAAEKAAAQRAGEQMTARIKAKAARPKENGTSTQSAVIVKSDVSSLTRADRAEAARQALGGKKIQF